jgi:hypothetical protein
VAAGMDPFAIFGRRFSGCGNDGCHLCLNLQAELTARAARTAARMKYGWT